MINTSDIFQPNLAHRAARSVAFANDGNAVILMVTAAEKLEAQRLVGAAPVVVATGQETKQFLTFMTQKHRKGK